MSSLEIFGSFLKHFSFFARLKYGRDWKIRYAKPKIGAELTMSFSVQEIKVASKKGRHFKSVSSSRFFSKFCNRSGKHENFQWKRCTNPQKCLYIYIYPNTKCNMKIENKNENKTIHILIMACYAVKVKMPVCNITSKEREKKSGVLRCVSEIAQNPKWWRIHYLTQNLSIDVNNSNFFSSSGILAELKKNVFNWIILPEFFKN